MAIYRKFAGPLSPPPAARDNEITARGDSSEMLGLLSRVEFRNRVSSDSRLERNEDQGIIIPAAVMIFTIFIITETSAVCLFLCPQRSLLIEITENVEAYLADLEQTL